MQRFVIIGLGNFGSSVAEGLYAEGHDVIAIDVNEDAVDRISSHVSRAAVADGRQLEALDRIGVEGSDTAVISTGDDITASLLTTISLRDLGVEDIYVKVISRNHARVMERMEVTETIFPERESALNLSSRLSERTVVNYVHISGKLNIQEMVVLDKWRGKSLRELKLRARRGISVVAVHDIPTGEMVAPPDPDAPLTEHDTLLIAGTKENLEAIARGED